MKNFKDLEEYLQIHSLEDSRYLSEPETVTAIIGHEESSGALVYEYGLLVQSFVEHFRKYDPNKTEEELVIEAEDWVSYNTLRSLPYNASDYVAYNKDGEEMGRVPIVYTDPKKCWAEAMELAGEGGSVTEVNYVNPIIIYSSKDWDDFCAPQPYEFDAEKTRKELVQWIKDWFEENGKDANAIIGMSGGKDSTIVAALCVEALGKDRVIGVSIPDKGQSINEADEICKYLGIRYIMYPIGEITKAFNTVSIVDNGEPKNGIWSNQSEQNVPPRVRMIVEYQIAQTYNGRPSCNCNLSEDFIGYSTFGGDSLGSFAPLSRLTVSEIKQIGKVMGLPKKWVDKTPDDGLPHSTPDEEKFGFTYATLDKYIREGICEDKEVRHKILDMHYKNLFKVQILRVPTYDPELPVKAW